jgi:hypothetical protein
VKICLLRFISILVLIFLKLKYYSKGFDLKVVKSCNRLTDFHAAIRCIVSGVS